MLFRSEHDQSANAGQFCVQFMIFTRGQSKPVRKWWQDRCLEWCYARFEDGKFGDQKYLDDWPIRFKELVHVMTNRELMLAPWNAMRFPYGKSVVWHFHSLRITCSSGDEFSVYMGDYQLPKCTREMVYLPYVNDICQVLKKVDAIGETYKKQRSVERPTLTKILKDRLRKFLQ